MTITANPLANQIGFENAEIALLWFKNYMNLVADLELNNGNLDGANTLKKVAFQLSETL